MSLIRSCFFVSPKYEHRFDYTTFVDEGQDGTRGGEDISDSRDTFGKALGIWMRENTIDGRTIIGPDGTHLCLAGNRLWFEAERRSEGANKKIEVTPYQVIVRAGIAPGSGAFIGDVKKILDERNYSEVMLEDELVKLAFFENMYDIARQKRIKRDQIYLYTA